MILLSDLEQKTFAYEKILISKQLGLKNSKFKRLLSSENNVNNFYIFTHEKYKKHNQKHI